MDNVKLIKNKNIVNILTKYLEEKQNNRWKIQTLIEALENELAGVKIQMDMQMRAHKC